MCRSTNLNPSKQFFCVKKQNKKATKVHWEHNQMDTLEAMPRGRVGIGEGHDFK